MKIKKITLKDIVRPYAAGLLIFLFVLAFFCLGCYVYASQTWPYPIIKEIERYVNGHPDEKSAFLDKILNDLKIKPSRLINKNEINLDKFKDLEGISLNTRREKPKIYSSEKNANGFRIMYGVFDFEEMLHGAILLNPQGEVQKYWPITQKDVEWEKTPDELTCPHGFVIASDGSMVPLFSNTKTLNKYDYCGNLAWRIEGANFNHVVSFDDGEKYIWTAGTLKEDFGLEKPYSMLKINYKNGEVVKKITMDELMEKNNDIDLFGLNQIDSVEESEWVKDPWHINDIEALPKDLADKYPLFEAGDLLLSFRNLNLICVINQDTLKIKWWSQGLFRRQHDPDWNSRGTITVFNNNMHREFSNIIEINPNTYEYSTPIEGKEYNFYSRIRGKHQLLDNGNFLITSTEQGRVFEVDTNGDIVFDFVNLYDIKDQEYLVLTEMNLLSENYFKDLPECNN